MKRAAKVAIASILAVALVGTGVYVAYALSPPSNPCAGYSSTSSNSSTVEAPTASPTPTAAASSSPVAIPPAVGASNIVIPVVAAENFWGSLVSQMGGTHVSVTSIVTDPNTDPHEYQANDSDALLISQARYVIVNNVGYDDWATQIIGADGASNQTVLNIGDMLGVHVTGGIVTGNPHLWYNPTYVQDAIGWMYDNLTAIAPSLTTYFQAQYAALNASLTANVTDWISMIKNAFGGTDVASTESIFVYLANATGLDLVSPPAFMEAIAEGNDPSDASVVTFQCQLESGQVKLLVYNEQTVTPITDTMKSIAASHNVTIVGVTETIQPPSLKFQLWMNAELISLYNGLNAGALGNAHRVT